MMQCADPHISSQQTVPAGVVCAYSSDNANNFPFLLPPADETEDNINIVKLSSKKMSIRKSILSYLYYLFILLLIIFDFFFM